MQKRHWKLAYVARNEYLYGAKQKDIGCTGSCLEEAGGPSSLYVSPDDSAALADAIQRILTDEDLRTKMIANGHTYAQRFDAEKLTMQMLHLYASTI